ncbi:P27 family phage terminase small subunit [Clostridium sp. CF012]|uniref:P27 family phage terminase small subunit n=1 Tax=Clostridium sp. CF012 TaxID=2843319 RepID=UPI001C0DC445|nr:P27 family phage terminase small subunit [Clostridium sp. CF012]MBU3146624.1 P27 family phage terminase small subunit [Clostridium sp. CF012]
MGRPTKPAIVLAECSQTKEEIQNRIDNEEKLKGNSDKIDPPDYLNNNQVDLFNYIKNELEASKLLSNLDIFILAKCAIAISRLQYIEKKVNDNPRLLSVQNTLMSNKKNYDADFFRCCNELSLSPAARAKLGNINLSAEIDKEDPVKKALRGD